MLSASAKLINKLDNRFCVDLRKFESSVLVTVFGYWGNTGTLQTPGQGRSRLTGSVLHSVLDLTL